MTLIPVEADTIAHPMIGMITMVDTANMMTPGVDIRHKMTQGVDTSPVTIREVGILSVMIPGADTNHEMTLTVGTDHWMILEVNQGGKGNRKEELWMLAGAQDQ